MKTLVFVFASLFLLTGCGGGVEISDRDFVVMAGIDKAEDGGYRQRYRKICRGTKPAQGS